MSVSISIILPVYNEAPALQETVNRLKVIASSPDIQRSEILIIDDGSTDGVPQEGRSSIPIRVFRHEKNTGYGSALKTGIRNAAYPVIVICDADGTYAVEALPKLLAQRQETALVVAARQTIPYLRNRAVKALLRKILELWLFIITYRWIKDVNSGFRVFSKSRVLPFLPDLSDRFSFTTGQTLVWIFSKYPIIYVPTVYSNRKGLSKVNFVQDGIIVFKQTIRLTLAYQPIRLISMTIVLCICLFLLLLR